MDIIKSIESCANLMEHNHKEQKAGTLRKNVSNILQKNLNLQIRSNLTKNKRRALKESQKDDKITADEFDKGCGFAIISDDAAKKVG